MMTNLLEEMQPEVREEAQGQQAKTQKGGTSEISEMRTVTDRPQNKDECTGCNLRSTPRGSCHDRARQASSIC